MKNRISAILFIIVFLLVVAIVVLFLLGLDKAKDDTPRVEPQAQVEPLPEAEPQIPERIVQMIRLYKPGDHGPAARARSFVEQGRFMEDYEDEGSWPEPRRLFYPTYHDLTPNMLRGYFTWRTAWRAGKRQETCSAFAYIHIYELLNGIGALLYFTDRMTVYPYSGALPGLKCFVAAVLGGIGSIPGAVIGGFIIGISETFLVALGYSTFSDAFTFVLLIIILLVRPTGLFGEAATDKVGGG